MEGLFTQIDRRKIKMRQMDRWNADTAKAAPIGAASLIGVGIVIVCCVAFQLAQPLVIPAARWIAAVLIVIAYLLFPFAAAGALYSVLFERPKALALGGLAITTLIVLVMLVLALPFSQILDGVLLLPFWFLAILGAVKFARWRAARADVDLEK